MKIYRIVLSIFLSAITMLMLFGCQSPSSTSSGSSSGVTPVPVIEAPDESNPYTPAPDATPEPTAASGYEAAEKTAEEYYGEKEKQDKGEMNSDGTQPDPMQVVKNEVWDRYLKEYPELKNYDLSAPGAQQAIVQAIMTGQLKKSGYLEELAKQGVIKKIEEHKEEDAKWRDEQVNGPDGAGQYAPEADPNNAPTQPKTRDELIAAGAQRTKEMWQNALKGTKDGIKNGAYQNALRHGAGVNISPNDLIGVSRYGNSKYDKRSQFFVIDLLY